jgi:tRNA (guanine37-N1)-methyltransferase
MDVPCVIVDRKVGEQTRRRLAAAGLLDRAYDIDADVASVYLPVTDAAAVPGDLRVRTHAVEPRDQQTTVAQLLGYHPSFERIGEIALIDEDDPETAVAIADAIMAADLPVTAVLNRRSPIEGTHRVRQWDRLAGASTVTTHREYGYAYTVDLATAYFSPRLATERRRVTTQITAGESVFDMFAGVGPYAIPAADRGAEVVAVDINPAATALLIENADRNQVDLTVHTADVRTLTDRYAGWADRVIMNLPHTAGEFLPDALETAAEGAILHYYDFQSRTDPFAPAVETIRAALPADVTLDVLETQEVRSYSPELVNICIDAQLQS